MTATTDARLLMHDYSQYYYDDDDGDYDCGYSNDRLSYASTCHYTTNTIANFAAIITACDLTNTGRGRDCKASCGGNNHYDVINMMVISCLTTTVYVCWFLADWRPMEQRKPPTTNNDVWYFVGGTIATGVAAGIDDEGDAYLLISRMCVLMMMMMRMIIVR